MKEKEMIERGFSADKDGKILDDFGNEYRNEEGMIEFLEGDEPIIEYLEKRILERLRNEVTSIGQNDNAIKIVKETFKDVRERF